MTILFHINYHTVPGQKLAVLGSIPELGGGEPFMAKEMKWVDNGNWTLQIDISNQVNAFEYWYLLVDINGERISEPWNKKRSISLDVKQKVYYNHRDNILCVR